VGASVVSPKGSRIMEGPSKISGDYRVALPVEIQRDYRNATAIEVQVEERTPKRIVSADGMPTNSRTNVNLYRGLPANEVDSGLILGKVSCGKLYEELAFLRKENAVLNRTRTELEQRANEEIPQQLADEVVKLRTENQALETTNCELRDRISEYAEHNTCHDALMGTTEMKLEELRQKQAAEAERNKDQLNILLHQNEKLNHELEEIRRERRGIASACMEEARPQIQALKQKNAQLMSEIEELRVSLDCSVSSEMVDELTDRLEDAQRQAAVLSSELEAVRRCHAKDVSLLRDENAGLQHKCSELEEEASKVAAQGEEERRQSNSLMQENRRLSMEVQQLTSDLRSSEAACERLEERRKSLQEEDSRRSVETDRRRSTEPPEDGEEEEEEECVSPCSLRRLKSVLTDQHATTEQIRQAIAAAEALLGEARREFASKQLRERRSCFERLHHAIDGEDEEQLVEAIALARRAEVDAEDIVKAEAKLALLQSLSEDQRREKALHELCQQRKKEAFLLVKKDDAEALGELLRGLDESVRWQDWRDYMGRNLWRFATEMRSVRAQACLAPLLGMRAPQDKRQQEQSELKAQEAEKAEERPAEPAEPTAAVDPAPMQPPSPAEEAEPAAEAGAQAPAPLTEAEEAAIKVKAFRAVVQDDTAVLLEILQRLTIEVWSKWQNKAGKDLLTLSQERGSSGAYSVLAKALGLVQEQRREAFDEREAVWIFTQGEVQPRRATVLEDTPAEADDVLVEYWDGDDPPSRVDRCLVRKMWS